MPRIPPPTTAAATDRPRPRRPAGRGPAERASSPGSSRPSTRWACLRGCERLSSDRGYSQSVAVKPPTVARLVRDAFARPERHSYGGRRLQAADLYLPRGGGPHRVVILIHGG